jgi:hypothetical protein
MRERAAALLLTAFAGCRSLYTDRFVPVKF